MENRPKIVIITNGNFFSRIILSRFISDSHELIKGVLVITGDYKGRTGLRSLFALMRVTAFSYIIFKVISIFFYKFIKLAGYSSPLFVKDLIKNKNFNYFESNSVKSNKVLEWLDCIQPDLLVSVSCPQLIGQKILSLSKLGGINIHSSLLPGFAGLAPYFWALSEGCKETGITIHYLSPKFDQGNILIQRKIDILPKESAFNLFIRLAKLGNENLSDAIWKAINGEDGKKQNLESYSYYSNPSILGYRKLRKNGHVLIRLNELISSLKNN